MRWRDARCAWASCFGGRPIFSPVCPARSHCLGSYFLCTAIPVAIILSLAATSHHLFPCPGASDSGGAGGNGRAFVGELSLLAAVCLHFESRRRRRVARKANYWPVASAGRGSRLARLARRFAHLPLVLIVLD